MNSDPEHLAYRIQRLEAYVAAVVVTLENVRIPARWGWGEPTNEEIMAKGAELFDEKPSYYKGRFRD
jgi:hypothetical protein